MPISMVTGKKIDELTDLLARIEPSHFHLGLYISARRISLNLSSIHQQVKDQIIPLDRVSLDMLCEALKDCGKDFHAASAFIASSEITLIPEGIFEPSLKGEYLNIVFGPSRKSSRSRHIEEMEVHSVFRMESSVEDSLLAVLPQLHFYHPLEALLMETRVNRYFQDSDLFRLYLDGADLYLTVFSGKSLKLFNVHHIGDPTDLVYHVLNTMDNYGVDYAQVQVSCSGDLEPREESYALLASYCPQVEFKGIGEEDENQREFILAHQRLCVS